MYKYSIANSIYNRKVGETETALGNLNQAKEQLDSISPSYNGKYANDIESLKNKISNKMVAEEDKSARETEMLNNKDKEQKKTTGNTNGNDSRRGKINMGKTRRYQPYNNSKWCSGTMGLRYWKIYLL